MGFYGERIFPYLLDWSMSDATFTQYRQDLLKDVQGDVLEIGFGTGLNMAHYPDTVSRLVAIDANPGMNSLAQKRVDAGSLAVDHRVLNGELLPFPDERFDSVVSTWTLCSIEKVEQALQEIHRVLRCEGKFFFIEHGLSPEPSVQTWQHRLNPLQKRIADGCNLDRNIRALVAQQFDFVQLEEFYADRTPKFLGYLYKGTATKA